MADYEVGWGKPPKASQFKKGQSGNPKGRPKGARNLRTLVLEELASRIPVVESGRQKLISKGEVIAKTLTNNAIKGKERSIDTILRLAEKQEERQAEAWADEQVTEDDEAIAAAHRQRFAREGSE